jgi:hypothetical protein
MAMSRGAIPLPGMAARIPSSARGIALLDRTRDRYSFREMQTRFPFSEDGIQAAIDAAKAMRCVKATIVVKPALIE